jgi:hypothetical protein
MNINIFVFLLNIAAGICGLGYFTYKAAKWGVKGFFFAGNEVAVLFFCLYCYILTRTSYKTRYMLLVYVVSFVVSFLIGTKTVVLSCLLLSLVDYYYRVRNRKYYYKLFFILFMLLMIVYSIVFFPQTEFYQFVSYQFSRTFRSNNNILNALLSGRLVFLATNYEAWSTLFSLKTFFLGMGAPSLIKGIEIDFVEVLFYYGIITLLIVLGFYMYIIWLSAKRRKGVLVVFNIIYLCISFTAGHVWYSVMAGLFFAYINAYELNVITRER